MSWLFSSASTNTAEFDGLVDKATSELLPPDNDETLLLSLQLSDLIRSKSIEAPLALKSLRRRLSHKNPNVQIQSLHVLDVLVKNSGEALLLAVANGKDGWLGQVEELCRSSNHDLQQLALKYVQNWALAFQSRDTSVALSNSDLVHLYNRLRYSLPFPAASQSLTSSMITSMSAPEWVDDELCQRCRTPFTLTNRKHHCRNCGGVFCGDCSSKTMKLEHLGINQEVRVCDGCYKKLSMPGGRSASVSRAFPSDSKSPPLQHRSIASVPSTSRKTQEDLDFERAIAMSLAESSATSNASAPPSSYSQSNALPGVGYGYEARSSQSYNVSQPTSTPAASALAEPGPMPSKQLEDEDPDLAAAIRASLAEVQPHSSTSQPSDKQYSNTPSAPYVYTPQHVPQPSVPSYELALAEFDALDSFSAVLPARQVSMDDANELFYRADRSRAKMIRALEDTAIKTDMLAELNGKLQRAVRLYDNLLERRISRYSQPVQQGYYSSQGVNQPHQQTYTQQPEYSNHQQAEQVHTASHQQPHQPYTYQSPQTQHQPHPSFEQARQQPQHQVYAQPGNAATTSMPALHRQSSTSYEQPTLQRHASGYEPSQTGQQDPSRPAYSQPPERNPWQEPSQPEQQSYAASTSYSQPYGQQHASNEDSQYYNETRQKSHDTSYSQQQEAPQSPTSQHPTAPYMSPSQMTQQLPPISPSLAASHVSYPTQQAYDQTHIASQEPPNYANGHTQPAQQDSHATPHAQQPAQPAEKAMYDSAGHKLRLQGYYTPSSFPAVPEQPVGGFPSVPNGELHDHPHAQHAAGYHTAAQEQPKKQEEALIEF